MIERTTAVRRITDDRHPRGEFDTYKRSNLVLRELLTRRGKIKWKKKKNKNKRNFKRPTRVKIIYRIALWDRPAEIETFVFLKVKGYIILGTYDGIFLIGVSKEKKPRIHATYFDLNRQKITTTKYTHYFRPIQYIVLFCTMVSWFINNNV